MKLFKIGLILLVLYGVFLLTVNAYCWENTNQTACEDDQDDLCVWKSDNWGSWCEDKGCWNYWTNDTCPDTINGTDIECTWHSSSGWGWCEMTMCSSFDGTNESACENNSEGLNCNWQNECVGWNSEVNCWELNQTACEATSGCNWGMCNEAGCWNYWNESACKANNGSKGQPCQWDSTNDYCYEKACWDYSGTNESACENNPEGLTCVWVNNQQIQNSCEEPSCWLFDFTNQTQCENYSYNNYNLSCTWDGTHCNMQQNCWQYGDQSSCNSEDGCSWRIDTGSGWCEELQCWNYDSINGHNQTECESSSLNCKWEGSSPTDGWCVKNFTATCGDIDTEKECMDTYYCWWEYADPSNPSLGGTCNDPQQQGTFFQEWNPGCYIFDMNSTKCNEVIGCNYSNGLCDPIPGHPNENEINTNGINCTMINDSELCNNIPVLSTCCQWNGTGCEENRMSTVCWDNKDKAFDEIGIESCEDVGMKSSDVDSAKQLCEQIAGDPYYMPCKWNNETKECQFKAEDVFGNNTQSCMYIDNENNCKAAGCDWITEYYCEGNRSVPSGRCESRGSSERNCNKACYACEYNFDGTNHTSIQDAKEYCYGSKLGYCEFIEDSTAPNGYGYCKAKEEFKKGIATDCKSDCGSCTFMGNPQADTEYSGTSKTYDTCNTPKCYCQQAYEFGNVNCKWVADSTADEGGYCVDDSEKTCADSCDRCYTRTSCLETGRSVFDASGSCEWVNENGDASTDEDDGICKKKGESAEICWNAIDDDNDNLIDCQDSECYSDPFCGFATGDCSWGTQTECESHNCTWMSDPWSSWCDFPGADCWKYDGNETACNAHNSTCDWSAGEGSGWCEQDWDMGQDCYNKMNESACTGGGNPNNCTWTNDSWCDSDGAGTDWCNNQGGWCDPAAFAPKQCWLHDDNETECNSTDGCFYDDGMCKEEGCWNYDDNQSACDAQSECSWQDKDWANCEMDWSLDCPRFDNQTECEANNCLWRNGTYGSWCDHPYSKCMDLSESECALDSDCYWNEWMFNPQTNTQGQCDAICFNPDLDQSSCEAKTGCRWSTGWCMSNEDPGGMNCWQYNDSTNCSSVTGCKWKNPGWCNPKGFAGGDAASGYGSAAEVGMECYKYDGNQSACENSTLTGMTCSWMPEFNPFCEPNWGAEECWQYDNNESACNDSTMCTWNSQGNFCTNVFDQCWQYENSSSCNSNQYCNWTNWGGQLGEHCEPVVLPSVSKYT